MRSRRRAMRASSSTSTILIGPGWLVTNRNGAEPALGHRARVQLPAGAVAFRQAGLDVLQPGAGAHFGTRLGGPVPGAGEERIGAAGSAGFSADSEPNGAVGGGYAVGDAVFEDGMENS